MATKPRHKSAQSSTVPTRTYRLRAHDYFETMRQISDDPVTLEAVKNAEIRHRNAAKRK